MEKLEQTPMSDNEVSKKSNLIDHFAKYLCQRIEQKLGVTTVEDLQALSDKKILSVPMFGKMALQKLRNLEKPKEFMIEKGHPEYSCQECGERNIGWFAPNELWNFVMSDSEIGIICPECFYRRAKAKGRNVWFTTIEE